MFRLKGPVMTESVGGSHHLPVARAVRKQTRPPKAFSFIWQCVNAAIYQILTQQRKNSPYDEDWAIRFMMYRD